MKPIEIVHWKCPVCNTVFEDKEEATECSSQPNPTPRYRVGDIVYVLPDNSTHYCPRTITKICGVFRSPTGSHEVGYNIDLPIYKGGRFSGSWTGRDEDEYPPLFENRAYQLGDVVMLPNFSDHLPLTKDLIKD